MKTVTMELLELVSPHVHVALPVIGVVLCALLVLALGFRSPQQPSFYFEEENDGKRIKKRVKQSKPRPPVNGLSVVDPPSQPTGKPSPKPVKEIKPAASPKIKQADKNGLKKAVKQDKKEKVKKQAPAEEEHVEKVARKEIEDDGEWTTIQVTKKNKKQQQKGKDVVASVLHGSASAPEVDTPVVAVADEAAAAAAVEEVVTEDVAATASTATSKTSKKKAKKDKVAKAPQEEKEETNVQQKEKPAEKKTSKKEKKTSGLNDGGAASGAVSTLPQEAAPASAKSVNKEETVDASDFVPVKASPKKKAKAVKDSAPVQKVEVKSDTKPTQASKGDSKETKKVDTKAGKVTPVEVAAPAETKPVEEVVPAAPVAAVTFDEIGDTWQEAAPKSKKKKPRRDN